MKRVLALATLLSVLAIAGFADVTVQSPANGATAQSPVRFIASAVSTQSITGMVIYVDSRRAYATSSASLNTSISMAGGRHAILVKAWNSSGGIYSSALTLQVQAGTTAPAPTPLQLSGSSLANGTVGSGYSATLQAAGGTSPYHFNLASGSLPAGIAVSTSGTISGTPTASGKSSFSVTVKDSATSPQAATSALAVTIVAAETAPPTGSSTLATAYDVYIAAHYGAAQGYTSSNTYYVSTTGSDNNFGTATSPWATLGHAGNAAPACSLILVASGAWTSTNKIVNLSGSGISTCHKSYVSQTYAGAVFKSTATPDDGGSVFQSSGNYVDLVGLDISGAACVGLLPTGVHNNLVYNRVHDIRPTSSGQAAGWCGNGTGGGGIAFGSGSASMGQSDQILNNFVWNVGYPGDVWTHGIYITSTNITIQNNIIYNVTGGCIQAYHYPSNDIITDNVLAACKWGYIVGYDGGTVTGMVFNDNIVANNSQWGIYECGPSQCGSGSAFGSNSYNNNLTYNNGNLMGGSGSLNKNVTGNPLFVAYASPSLGGNFAVTNGSPALNAGTSSDASSMDILGVSRSLEDIGAYEQ